VYTCVCVCIFVGLPSTEIVQPGDVIDALYHYPIHVCMCVFYVCMRVCVCVQICKYMNTKVLLSLQHAAARYNTIQHTKKLNTLQRTATHCIPKYVDTQMLLPHTYIFFARSHVHTQTHIHAHFLFPFSLFHHTHFTHMCCSHARLSFSLSAR